MASDESSATERPIHRVAATVVLLRDGAAGLEVLMLERPHDRGSFAGAWVFPGGSVDVGDGLVTAPEREARPGEEEAARRAAVREVREETALELVEDELVLVACWTPPPSVPKRFRTWFYYARAQRGEVALSPDESVDSQWIRPEVALELHAAGTLSLVPPTWVSLHALVNDHSVDDTLERTRDSPHTEFVTRVVDVDGGHLFLWGGDVAYSGDVPIDAEGGRHRLDTRTLPWSYRYVEHSPNESNPG